MVKNKVTQEEELQAFFRACNKNGISILSIPRRSSRRFSPTIIAENGERFIFSSNGWQIEKKPRKSTVRKAGAEKASARHMVLKKAAAKHSIPLTKKGESIASKHLMYRSKKEKAK